MGVNLGAELELINWPVRIRRSFSPLTASSMKVSHREQACCHEVWSLSRSIDGKARRRRQVDWVDSEAQPNWRPDEKGACLGSSLAAPARLGDFS
ncbi:MAG: hypothetical protein NBV65_00180 [Burkholderiaceae bacterium]|nr:hypothetical protein [Burkholderiaceae bacterium]